MQIRTGFDEGSFIVSFVEGVKWVLGTSLGSHCFEGWGVGLDGIGFAVGVWKHWEVWRFFQDLTEQ